MKEYLEAFLLQENDVIASIGAGSGVWEMAWATYFEHLTFYIQDIDPLQCNTTEITNGLAYYEKLMGKPISSTFIPVQGSATYTNLPSNTFDKVLIINSLHEFESPALMIQDIRRIVKKTGLLFIEESLAQQTGELHPNCQKPLFTRTELVLLLKRNKFVYQAVTTSNNQSSVFCFRIDPD